MSYWIFQAVPERYDLRREPIEGHQVTWLATRYRTRMEVGDLVYFWLGGAADIRGIYGWGHLKSTPYTKDDWDGYGIDVAFERRLQPFLSIHEIKREPQLSGMQILNMAIGSNFHISRDEAKAISALLSKSQRPTELG